MGGRGGRGGRGSRAEDPRELCARRSPERLRSTRRGYARVECKIWSRPVVRSPEGFGPYSVNRGPTGATLKAERRRCDRWYQRCARSDPAVPGLRGTGRPSGSVRPLRHRIAVTAGCDLRLVEVLADRAGRAYCTADLWCSRGARRTILGRLHLSRSTPCPAGWSDARGAGPSADGRCRVPVVRTGVDGLHHRCGDPDPVVTTTEGIRHRPCRRRRSARRVASAQISGRLAVAGACILCHDVCADLWRSPFAQAVSWRALRCAHRRGDQRGR